MMKARPIKEVELTRTTARPLSVPVAGNMDILAKPSSFEYGQTGRKSMVDPLPPLEKPASDGMMKVLLIGVVVLLAFNFLRK